MKTIVTITGIRPDFIRMSQVFKELDKKFRHVLIHTGQHQDKNLSDVIFQQLKIREPDQTLNMGRESGNHFEQLSYLTREIPKLFKEKNIQPDLILFLGDSNSAGVAFPLKKEGYKIGHIEAGMRSQDKRMLEEINRTVCDHCSDILFVYHEDQKSQLARENIIKNVQVVGNTILEPFAMFKGQILTQPKQQNHILMDCHRPENFKQKERLEALFRFANLCARKYRLPVYCLQFKRLVDAIHDFGIDVGEVQMIPLMTQKDYLTTVYHSRFLISDSGTGQEEPALLNTPVVVPRDFTERPQSYTHNCSTHLDLVNENQDAVFEWLRQIDEGRRTIDASWLGDGKTSHTIVDTIEAFLNETE